jgi:hypothetical protein
MTYIAAADTSILDFNNDIVSILQFWHRPVLERHLSLFLEYE